MSYSVKEIFLSIQGEGANSGRAAVFCRFSGCNLWSGKSEDREEAKCSFCDTDFLGTDGTSGGIYQTPAELIQKITDQWHPVSGEKQLYPYDEMRQSRRENTPKKPRMTDGFGGRPLVVCTGGEPLLQLDGPLISGLHRAGFEVAVETNGTIRAPEHIDWLAVSPKSGTTLLLQQGDELKLVFPQKNLDPESFVDLGFTHFFLQPMSGPDREKNTRLALEYCLSHPIWRLGIQLHTYLGIR